MLAVRHRRVPVGPVARERLRLQKVDPALRRRVLIGLNKGEHLHSLARGIAFGRQGRFHDRRYEAQLNRASALSVVINAIAVWNTRYFERAQAALARQGVPVPEQTWQHFSTLQWVHIHLNGSYHFTDITLKGDFRPLRGFLHTPPKRCTRFGGVMQLSRLHSMKLAKKPTHVTFKRL